MNIKLPVLTVSVNIIYPKLENKIVGEKEATINLYVTDMEFGWTKEKIELKIKKLSLTQSALSGTALTHYFALKHFCMHKNTLDMTHDQFIRHFRDCFETTIEIQEDLRFLLDETIKEEYPTFRNNGYISLWCEETECKVIIDEEDFEGTLNEPLEIEKAYILEFNGNHDSYILCGSVRLTRETLRDQSDLIGLYPVSTTSYDIDIQPYRFNLSKDKFNKEFLHSLCNTNPKILSFFNSLQEKFADIIDPNKWCLYPIEQYIEIYEPNVFQNIERQEPELVIL